MRKNASESVLQLLISLLPNSDFYRQSQVEWLSVTSTFQNKWPQNRDANKMTGEIIHKIRLDYPFQKGQGTIFFKKSPSP